jgi:enoyl-CoA hydratase
MRFQTLLVSTDADVGIIQLNRPDVRNALNTQVMDELTAALDAFEADDAIGAIVITGGEKAFAAGADIKDMAPRSYAEVMAEDFITRNWERTARCRKPVIAAVAGVALGGGCELAMMCDFIYAADDAQFGQPEILLGVMPGAGGTQRLTRAIGKAKAMEMCLTGRRMDAAEAEKAGLVARVFPKDKLREETLKTAHWIAALSRPALYLCKDAVNRAFEASLAEGVHFERRVFHSLFAMADQKEGMAAFMEKRQAKFQNK